RELGVPPTGQSTISGKGKKGEPPPHDSDIKLATDDELMPGSDKLLEAPGSKLIRAPHESDVLGGSDIKGKGGSGTGDMPPMPGSKPPSSGGTIDLGPNLTLDEREESD